MRTARFAALDGLRGLLALLVTFAHATGHFLGWESSYFFDFNLRYSVDIFFVLSGVVLSYAYAKKLQNKQISIINFFKIRFFRLVPLYVFSTFIIIVFFILQWHTLLPSWISNNTLSTIFANILPIQLIFIKSFPVINHPAWSVCTELFCGTFIFIVFIYSRLVFIACFLTSFFMIASGYVNIVSTSSLVYFIPEASYRCVFAMSCGIFAFNFIQYIKSIGIIESFIAILGILVLFGEKPNNIYYIIYTLIFAYWIVSLTKSESGVALLLKSKPLTYLGKISYSLYLIHIPIILIMLRLKTNDLYLNIVVSLLATGVAVIISNFIFKDVELPLIQYMKSKISTP